MRWPLCALLIAGCAESTSPSQAESHDTTADAAAISATCETTATVVAGDFVRGALSAKVALAALGGPTVQTMQWGATGERAQLTLDVSATGGLRYLDSAGALGCPDLLLVDALVQLTTDDGRLEEVFSASLRHEGGDTVRLERWVALDQLVGSYAPRELDEQLHTAADLSVEADLSAAGSIGELALYAQRGDGTTESWSVARWPADPE